MNRDGLYRVTLSYCCAGVTVAGGYIIRVAPILRWARGKPVGELERWVHRKGGTLEWIAP